MAGPHDRIAAAQAGTYGTLDIRLFTHLTAIGSTETGAVMRLAHCRVPERRQEHFVRSQAEVWNPGMLSAPGLRGGVFARRGADEFLVLSFWRSAADHEDYRRDRFPELHRRSGAAGDLAAITGEVVVLEAGWAVG